MGTEERTPAAEADDSRSARWFPGMPPGAPYRRLFALSVAIGAVLMLASPARAEQPPIAFEGDTPLELRPGEPKTLTLVNNTVNDFVVSVRAVRSSGGATPAVKLNVTEVEIGPGGAATVVATAPIGTAAANGFVVAIASRAGGTGRPEATARRGFAVIDEIPLEPLVEEWSATSYVEAPSSGRALHNAILPVEGASRCPRDAAPIDLGTVTTANGGVGMVKGACVAGGPGQTSIGLKLSFDGLGTRVGDFTGTVDLVDDDDEAGEVELTLRSTHTFVLPSVFILIGIVLAILVAWSIGRGHRLSEDEEDVLLLMAQADEADREFRQRAGVNPWAYYSFEPSLSNECRLILDELRRLRRRWSELAAGDPEQTALLDRRKTLEKLVAAWPAFATRLRDLATALDDVAQVSTSMGRQPAFVEEARKLLRGEPLEVTNAMKRIEEVELAASTAEAWEIQIELLEALEEQAALARAAIEKEPPDSPKRVTFDQAERKLSEAREELLSAPDVAALVSYDIRGDLEAARQSLAQLASLWRRVLGAAEIADAGLGLTGSLASPALSILGRILSAASGPAGDAATVRLRRRLRNILALAVLGFTALWTGLTTLYFDKPFGTVRDYIGALLWGATVQATLVGLAAGVDRFRTRRPHKV